MGSHPSEIQGMALRILEEYELEIKASEDKIQTLRSTYIPEIKSIYNSRANINRLPIELLMLIFRAVGPYTSPADGIRLTHVCRSWRSLIHNTPSFWLDFLDPEGEVIAFRPADYPIVVAAFERSAPATNVAFAMKGEFLPYLPTIPNHVSRITTLWLGCFESGDRYIETFFELDMPQLENLTLWMRCSHPDLPVDRKVHSSARYPNLRELQTNCARFSLVWIGPTVRELWLGANRNDVHCHEQPDPPECCSSRSLDQLLEALLRCPNLTTLSLDSCLPRTLAATSGQLPTAALPNLEYLDLRGSASVIRSVIEHVAIPVTTDVSLTSEFDIPSPYSALSDLVPTTYPVSALVPIHRLTVKVGDTKQVLCEGCSIWGEADNPDEDRLSLHSMNMKLALATRDDTGNHRRFNLFRFFQGFVPLFPSSSITYLKLSCCDPFLDNGAFTYIFEHYPQIIHLVLGLSSLENIFQVLARDEILPHLERLDVTSIVDDRKSPSEHEIVVAALETRTSTGRRLKSFSFVDQVPYDQDDLPPPMADDLVRRLASMISDLSIEEPRHMSQ